MLLKLGQTVVVYFATKNFIPELPTCRGAPVDSMPCIHEEAWGNMPAWAHFKPCKWMYHHIDYRGKSWNLSETTDLKTRPICSNCTSSSCTLLLRIPKRKREIFSVSKEKWNSKSTHNWPVNLEFLALLLLSLPLGIFPSRCSPYINLQLLR